MDELITKLCAAMARITGTPAELENFRRLSGGANMESTAFVWAGAGYVMRRAPSAEMMAGRAMNHKSEAALVRQAFAGGVRAPDVIGDLEPEDDLGTGYIMRRVEAEVNPAVILADPPVSLVSDIARELARIHALPVAALPAVPSAGAADILEDLFKRYQTYGADRPILSLAFKWCRDHLPPPIAPCLVHGDFRMGNVMVDKAGLAVVLDWELAHIGDYHEDLAYGCMSVWRFGHIDKPAFGCGDLETYFAAYEAQGGQPVDRARFRWWLILRTLWWALGCMQMGDIWRNGVDRSLERVVIGRRAVENECDLLLLLEEDAPETQRIAQTASPTPTSRRMGEPSTVEMLEALSEWVAAEIKPKAEGRAKFEAAVAINALGMLAREAAHPVDLHDRALADDLIEGRRTLATPGLLARLRRDVLAKLANDSPKYASLAKARVLWITG
jgi:aminoglycoside phosphotransferase (APT) family kinase protein